MSGYLASMGPAVLNHLWQSTMFAAVAGVAAVALRRNPARVRYWLWLAASVKFLLPFSLLVAAGSYLARPHVVVQPRVSAVVNEVSAPLEVLMAPVHEASAPVPASYAAVRRPVVQREAAAVVSPQEPVQEDGANFAAAGAAPAAVVSWREHMRAWMPMMLASVWLGGLILVLMVWLVRWRRVAAARRSAVVQVEGREAEILRALGGGVALRLSQETMEPGIFGMWRPVLLWPMGLSEKLEDEHIEAILAHEREHVRRRDNLTAALHMVVEALFWFHPAVWWMERRMVEERERACDEAVVERCGRAEAYAESLLRACRFCVESPLVCVAGITGADLSKRVRSIMTLRLQRLSLARKLALAMLAICVVLAPVMLGQMRREMEMGAPATRSVSMRLADAAVRMVSPMQRPAAAQTGTVTGAQHELYSIAGANVLRWWPMSVSGERGGTVDPAVIGFAPLVPPPGVFAGKEEMKGLALVGLTVDESGRPRDVHVVRGLTPSLNTNALKAVELMRFRPAMRDGKPAPFALDVIADFDHVATTQQFLQTTPERERQFHFFAENVEARNGQQYRLEDGVGEFHNTALTELGLTQTLRFDAAEHSVVLQWLPPALTRPAAGYCAASYERGDAPMGVPEVHVELPCAGAYAAKLREVLQRFWIIWPQPVMEVTGANGRVGTMTINVGPIPMMKAHGYVVVTADGRFGATDGELQPLLAKMGVSESRAAGADRARIVLAEAEMPQVAGAVAEAENARRIDYANTHFGNGSVPGWKSDRGMIYIRYGKPDGITDHPGGEMTRTTGGQTVVYPFQVWHYRYLAGVGDNIDIEFVDACRCGEYRMTLDRGSGAQMSIDVQRLEELYRANVISRQSYEQAVNFSANGE